MNGEKIYHGNTNQRKAGVCNFQIEQISEQEKLTGIEKGFTKWRSLYFKEDIMIFTVWKKSIKYARQKLLELQEEMDESTVIVGDFTISLSEMDQYSRHKSSKDIFELNSTINQLDIINIYWLLHPSTAGYMLFSQSQGIFTKRENNLDHKTQSKETEKKKKKQNTKFLLLGENYILNYKSLTKEYWKSFQILGV